MQWMPSTVELFGAAIFVVLIVPVGAGFIVRYFIRKSQESSGNKTPSV